jgi:hypothetical protein
VPPTEDLPSRLQPKIANTAAATDIHAKVFTRPSPNFVRLGIFRPQYLEIIPGSSGFSRQEMCSRRETHGSAAITAAAPTGAGFASRSISLVTRIMSPKSDTELVTRSAKIGTK